MSSSLSASVKKRGRPKTTGTPRTIGVRVHDDAVDALDTWIALQPDPKPSRPEAIRIALKDWLTGLGLLNAPTIPEKIARLEEKIAAMPGHSLPSPEAGMATMRKALAEDDLVKLKNVRTRTRRGPASGSKP